MNSGISKRPKNIAKSSNTKKQGFLALQIFKNLEF